MVRRNGQLYLYKGKRPVHPSPKSQPQLLSQSPRQSLRREGSNSRSGDNFQNSTTNRNYSAQTERVEERRRRTGYRNKPNRGTDHGHRNFTETTPGHISHRTVGRTRTIRTNFEKFASFRDRIRTLVRVCVRGKPLATRQTHRGHTSFKGPRRKPAEVGGDYHLPVQRGLAARWPSAAEDRRGRFGNRLRVFDSNPNPLHCTRTFLLRD